MAEAQKPAKTPRLGFLANGSASSELTRIAAFQRALSELGYVEGQNIAIEYRYADGKLDRLPGLAAELVGLKVDIIMAVGIAAAHAAKNATTTIPIVMPIVADPVASGLVVSLARPGGNITGFSTQAPELSQKRLELLREAFPKVSRVAVLWNPEAPAPVLAFKETQAAAKVLGLQLQSLQVRSPDGFESAFSAMRRERAGALQVLSDLLTQTYRARIVALAANSRLPAVYQDSQWVKDGGLMSYGPDLLDLYRRAATYVDKILKGAKPADLPVEQPMKFELVINLKTAKQIGLTIPPNVVVRADKVIK